MPIVVNVKEIMEEKFYNVYKWLALGMCVCVCGGGGKFVKNIYTMIMFHNNRSISFEIRSFY